ncbi:MAG: hypothetical protein Q8P95_05405 [bacterium]|nr:hypothetical protein [bacterium]
MIQGLGHEKEAAGREGQELLPEAIYRPDDEILLTPENTFPEIRRGKGEVVQTLDCLPRSSREVFFLRYIRGLSNKQCAGILGDSEIKVSQLALSAAEKVASYFARGNKPGSIRFDIPEVRYHLILTRGQVLEVLAGEGASNPRKQVQNQALAILVAPLGQRCTERELAKVLEVSRGTFRSASKSIRVHLAECFPKRLRSSVVSKVSIPLVDDIFIDHPVLKTTYRFSSCDLSAMIEDRRLSRDQQKALRLRHLRGLPIKAIMENMGIPKRSSVQFLIESAERILFSGRRLYDPENDSTSRIVTPLECVGILNRVPGELCQRILYATYVLGLSVRQMTSRAEELGLVEHSVEKVQPMRRATITRELKIAERRLWKAIS